MPLVVTLTGTDANHDLADIARAATVRAVLDGASPVTAFHESIVGRVLEIAPSLRGQLWWCPSRCGWTAPSRSICRRAGPFLPTASCSSSPPGSGR